MIYKYTIRSKCIKSFEIIKITHFYFAESFKINTEHYYLVLCYSTNNKKDCIIVQIVWSRHACNCTYFIKKKCLKINLYNVYFSGF